MNSNLKLMTASVPISIVDAFTELPFSGNQAAVCLIGDKYPSESVLQAIAAEMNLAETAFIVSKNGSYKESDSFDLRWFTPTNEVPLCGHATLASAATLFNVAQNINSKIKFSTLSGNLYVSKGENGFLNMDLPLNSPVQCEDIELYKAIYKVVLNHVKYYDYVKEIWLSKTAKKLVIVMKDDFTRADLESIKPDINKMLTVHDGSNYKGVILTTFDTDKKYDFISRYFAPWNGIPEDHVTGSAHTVLGPLWASKLNKVELLGRQCSKRGGDVKVRIREDNRVDVCGKAMLVLTGQINIPK